MAQPIVPSLTPATDPMDVGQHREPSDSTSSSPEPESRMLRADTKPAAKLLAAPMLDATITGPALQTAHRNIGWYLATQYVSDVCGIESITSEQHPNSGQPSRIIGYRLKDEEKTLIVAVTRSGEPMAQGVHAVFPSASFLHVTDPEDITNTHIRHSKNIIIVDSVINTVSLFTEFIKRICNERNHTQVKIVGVVGVMESDCLLPKASFQKDREWHKASVVTLVVSKTSKYLQRDDTGHRLFNTSYTVSKMGFS